MKKQLYCINSISEDLILIVCLQMCNEPPIPPPVHAIRVLQCLPDLSRRCLCTIGFMFFIPPPGEQNLAGTIVRGSELEWSQAGQTVILTAFTLTINWLLFHSRQPNALWRHRSKLSFLARKYIGFRQREEQSAKKKQNLPSEAG